MVATILSGPKFKLPLYECSTGEFFFNNAEKYADRICQIDGGEDKSETFGSVKLRSTRVAIALQKKGITSNDVISFCSSNTLNNTIPMLASFYLGAKVANFEGSLSVRHTKHLLSLVKPRMIFVEESALGLIEESLDNASFRTEIVVFGNSSNPQYLSFLEFEQPQENEMLFRPVPVDVNDGILMLFSSGSTGLPKAIIHSHRSFLCFILQTYQSGFRGSIFHLTTFYWLTAYMLLGCCFITGCFRIFTRNPLAEDIFNMIQKYKISEMFMTPIYTYKLTSFKNAENYDTSSLKLIVCAGTSMAPSQIKKMNKCFPTAITILACGMSEIGIVTTFDAEDDRELATTKFNTCGKPAAGIQLKIVDPDTEELLGPNQKGEIRLKSPSMMKGYYGSDASSVFDKDGFLKTGDVGYYDEDGCVAVIERLKEVFKYQSWHIIPSSLESVLLEHPSIKEAAVFGLPHIEDGEVPAACVVIKEGFNLSAKEIDTFLKEKVADAERLRGGVTFVDSLPRTPTGKVVRKEVKDLVLKSKNVP